MAAKYCLSQAILSFFKQYKRRKAIKVGACAKHRQGHTQSTSADVAELENKFVVAVGEELTGEDWEHALNLDEEASTEDSGQEVHDDKIVKTLKAKAISKMAERGIQTSASENTQALALFPKACNVHAVQHNMSQ